MKFKALILIMLSALLAGSAFAQQVSVNYNHNASFANYHTYAWGSNNKNQIQNSILAQVAQQDIENAMAAKGFQKVEESANPDLILTASGGEREQTSYNAWGMRGWGGGMGSITPQQNVEATMIVSLYDLESQRAGVARYRPGHAGQQWQQEPGHDQQGRAEDVQAVAQELGRVVSCRLSVIRNEKASLCRAESFLKSLTRSLRTGENSPEKPRRQA